MENVQFFSDFDGTITKEDTLNKFLRVYADQQWLEVEECWIKGEIGSRECIEEQMKLFPSMTQELLDEFIDTIEIDETFPDFLEWLKSENVDFNIVSDGFDMFIEAILKKNNIDTRDIKIFSNKLTFKDGKFITEFPYKSEDCGRKSGVCKCNVVKLNRIVTNSVLYAGDGLSDFCVSDKVNILFAKESLLEYCKDTKIDNLIGFDSFAEIKNYMKQHK